MQEHIRRAHPEHYISKLPATEESFMLMINTPPSERPPNQQNSAPAPQGSCSDLRSSIFVVALRTPWRRATKWTNDKS